ncbi:DUF4397 domain-containing protein [Pedobacter deserti]|uniref:DUF4397 domain-containing protein n=1 Tax=Pedobacter deserti TaxID=2817382 RepID=UPI00210F0174|nr:DUF4397 domain-containing protein [Pedobacter sp. SYSU D00382]
MKNKFLSKGMFMGAIVLALATTVSSCKKDDIDESGSANVKVVNASTASTAQGFYLAGRTVVQGGLTFGNASDYISVNSGNNLQLQFRNEGSSSNYASAQMDLDNGAYYTVFLAGDGQAARVKVYKDDRSAPTSGKVKVRFAHLSDAAPSTIDIRTSAGTTLIAGLNRDNASNYIEVNPGVMSLQVFGAGQDASVGTTFDITALAENRIYTIYVTGSTESSISVRQISHN